MKRSSRRRPALPRLLVLPAFLLACGRLGYDLIDEVEVGAGGPDGGSGAASSGSGASTGSGGGSSANGGSAATPSGGTTAGTGANGGAPTAAGGAGDMGGAPTGGGVSGNAGVPGAGGCGAGEICDGLDSDCSCSAGCDGYTYDGHAYAFCSTARNRAGASSDCAAMGMQLVRIDSEPENTWVRDLLASYGGTNNTADWVWIGAEDIDDDGVWLWPDGAAITWDNWANGNPGNNDGCAQMQNQVGAYWNSMSCTTTNRYVCELY